MCCGDCHANASLFRSMPPIHALLGISLIDEENHAVDADPPPYVDLRRAEAILNFLQRNHATVSN